MKKKKLNLDSLKVESFVTEFKKEEENTVVGGLASIGRHCTENQVCQIHLIVTKGAFCTTRI
ncbi:MAG: pinensin family lanthipeptide [Bacteroidota bacterium]